MNNYKMILTYDGREYNGWQKQGDSSARTIQGKIEEILNKMFPEENGTIEIHGSGRTDAGVHALGQVASVHLPGSKSEQELLHELNHYLPKDIRVRSVEQVEDRFHARLHATAKTYIYRIDNAKVSDPFVRKYRTRVEEPLDVKAMKEAAKQLVGEWDFTAFSTGGGKKKSKVREIYSLQILENSGAVDIQVRGSGFLYNMVRIIAGTLIEVGLHKRTVESVGEALHAKNRGMAGITAPPTGLFLMEVEYE